MESRMVHCVTRSPALKHVFQHVYASRIAHIPSRRGSDEYSHPMVCICQGSVAVTSAALRLKTRVASAGLDQYAARQPRVQHSRVSESYDKNPTLAIDRLLAFHPPVTPTAVTSLNYSSCLNNFRIRPLRNPSDPAWVPW